MSKLDTLESGDIRNRHGYQKRFDIVLAAASSRFDGGEDKFGFYDRIERIANKMDKKIFLRHKEIEDNWDSRAIEEIPNEVVIPTSELVVAYLGLQSETTKKMLSSARFHRVPIIALYEITSLSNLYDYRKIARFSREISMDDSELGFNELEKAMRRFYKLPPR